MRRQLLDRFETCSELVAGRAKCELSINVEVPGHVDNREQQVAELIGFSVNVAVPDRFAQFTSFFDNFWKCPVNVRPIETNL